MTTLTSHIKYVALVISASVLRAMRVLVSLVRIFVAPVLISFVIVFGELVLYFVKGVARIGRTSCR